jgi:hypothetical protein
MICSNILRTTRHVDTFKLARVLRTASHDIIHEARLVINDVDTGGVGKITCAQVRGDIHES